MGKSNTLGAWGEAQAEQYLRNKGFFPVGQNYRCPYGELDLIAQNGEYLVFAEVKLRKTARFAPAADFVDRKKQERIRITAAYWLMEHETALQPRFDIVEVYAPYGEETVSPVIYHWEGAFE